MLNKTVVLFIFLCTLVSDLFAQLYPYSPHFPANYFSHQAGLPDESIWSMVLDESGMLWIGTQGGLARYDGVSVRPVNKVSINVRTLTLGPNGNLWMTTGDGELYHYNRAWEIMTRILPDDNGEGHLLGIPRTIEMDLDSNLWVGTDLEGIYRLDFTQWDRDTVAPRLASVDHFSRKEGSFLIDQMSSLSIDKKGRIWVSQTNGIAEWNRRKKTFEYILLDTTGQPHSRMDYSSISSDPRTGLLWWLKKKSVMAAYDPAERTVRWHQLSEENGLRSSASPVRIHLVDSKGQVWIEYREGGVARLGYYSPENKNFQPVTFQFDRPLAGRYPGFVKVMVEDSTENIWIGAHLGGLTQYMPYRNDFRHVASMDPEADWEKGSIMDVLIDGNGVLWARNARYQLLQWNSDRKRWVNFFDYFKSTSTAESLKVGRVVKRDIDGNIWTWSADGLFRYLASEKRVERLNARYPLLDERQIDGISGFLADEKNKWWVIPRMGKIVCRIDHANNRIDTVMNRDELPEKDQHTYFFGLFRDSSGMIWVGTSNNGFFRYDPSCGDWWHFAYSPARVRLEDTSGYIYAASYSDGLIRVNPNTLECRLIDQKDGLPAKKVRGGMVIDRRGRIWIGTHLGLARYDTETGEIRSFSTEEGLPSNIFTALCTGETKEGELIFGTEKGMVAFHPDSLEIDPRPPKLVFAEFALDGQTIDPGDREVLKKGLRHTEEIHLRHDQHDFTISYSALHFKNPRKIEYAVRLLPYQSDWREVGNENSVDYTNLSPGAYNFRVKAANGDGVWNEQGISLRIIIHPPWYWNGWSKAAYLGLALMLIFGLYRFQLRRRLALAEADRLRELDEWKTRLYTNVTHEFRTPLTVIKGLAARIRGHEEEKEGIQRNSDQLLALVNRILDLAKLEAGKISCRPIHGDIIHFLRYVTESFHSYALNQKINLIFHSDEEEVEMDYDPEKILRLLSNLLSNALKFTPEYGKVRVMVSRDRIHSQPTLSMRVSDTGIGIDPEALPHIFDRFFQSDTGSTRQAEGTGIGLALVREYLELMDGRIEVESQMGEGTVFTVFLPIRREAHRKPVVKPRNFSPRINSNLLTTTREAERVVDFSEGDVNSDDDEARPWLLIVEDNRDVMGYLTVCLREDYHLLYARNGREGIDLAIKSVPDVIVSDVMMPLVDGFTLCETLKTDERTSHIPIILLTAKADPPSKVAGLRTGADAYLAKPFDEAELLVRLQKMIELRKRLRDRYGTFALADLPRGNDQFEREDDFLRKVKAVINTQLSKAEFGLEELGRALGVSRVQLYRKLKNLTDRSPAQLIRLSRLQRARQLLFRGDATVGEVVFMVGFRDHSHFTKLYKETFDELPSDTAKNRNEQ